MCLKRERKGSTELQALALYLSLFKEIDLPILSNVLMELTLLLLKPLWSNTDCLNGRLIGCWGQAANM